MATKKLKKDNRLKHGKKLGAQKTLTASHGDISITKLVDKPST